MNTHTYTENEIFFKVMREKILTRTNIINQVRQQRYDSNNKTDTVYPIYHALDSPKCKSCEHNFTRNNQRYIPNSENNENKGLTYDK